MGSSPRIHNPANAPHWLRDTIDSAQRTMDHQYRLFGRGPAGGYNPTALTQLLDQIAASDAHHPGYPRALSGLRTRHQALDAADSTVGDTGLTRTKAVSDWGKQQLDGIVAGLNDRFHAVAGNPTADPLSSLAGQQAGHPANPAALSPRAHMTMLNDLDGGLRASARVVRHATTEARHIAHGLSRQDLTDNGVDYSKPLNYSDTIVNRGVWTA